MIAEKIEPENCLFPISLRDNSNCWRHRSEKKKIQNRRKKKKRSKIFLSSWHWHRRRWVISSKQQVIISNTAVLSCDRHVMPEECPIRWIGSVLPGHFRFNNVASLWSCFLVMHLIHLLLFLLKLLRNHHVGGDC